MTNIPKRLNPSLINLTINWHLIRMTAHNQLSASTLFITAARSLTPTKVVLAECYVAQCVATAWMPNKERKSPRCGLDVSIQSRTGSQLGKVAL